MVGLRPFQRRFVREATAPGIDVGVLSLPRGNGKSWLAGHVLTRALTPGDPLFEPGKEYILLAASVEQARIVFRFVRDNLEGAGGYKFQDSAVRIGVRHVATNTRLRTISSNAKTAMGLVNNPLVIADEPGAWETTGGRLMFDALWTALGKPGSRMRVMFLGTLAPASSGWWHSLVAEGSFDNRHVTCLQRRKDNWDLWHEIRRCNPLVSVSADFRKQLLRERDEARRDSRLKARFMSYRLNLPSADEATMALDVSDWERACARPVPEPEGRPVVGVDLGGGRAWSAAVALWKNGRCEALACAPGIPALAEQERRDRAPAGLYEALARQGALDVAEGLRVQRPEQLVAAIRARWGRPARLVCDRFRLAELQDSAGDITPEPRVSRWSDAAADLRALRKMAKDGPLAPAEGSRDLLAASLAAAMVKNDDQGSFRLVKRDTSNNSARDDVAAALVLAAGAWERAGAAPSRPRRHALAG